jgi:hypothetical protein
MTTAVTHHGHDTTPARVLFVAFAMRAVDQTVPDAHIIHHIYCNEVPASRVLRSSPPAVNSLVEAAVWLAYPLGTSYPQDEVEKRKQHVHTAEKR